MPGNMPSVHLLRQTVVAAMCMGSLLVMIPGSEGFLSSSATVTSRLSLSSNGFWSSGTSERRGAGGMLQLSCSVKPHDSESSNSEANGLSVSRRQLLRGAGATAVAGLGALGVPMEKADAREVRSLVSDADTWPGFLPERQVTVKGKEVKIFQEFSEKRKNGMAIYEGNLVLANYLQSLPESYWKGKNVLELGCGTGFGSITASICGAASVTASDRDPNVLSLAGRNLARNLGADGPYKTARVAWGTPQCQASNTKSDVDINVCWEKEAKGAKGYDLIIGSDLTYTAELIPKIVDTIKQMSSSKGEVVLCWCEPDLFNWNTDVMEQLNRAIAQFNQEFQVETISSGPIVAGHDNTFLLHMRPKKA